MLLFNMIEGVAKGFEKQLEIQGVGFKAEVVGEEVVLVGKSGEEVITVEEVANKLQTSPYEVVVNLANRVTRIYK